MNWIARIFLGLLGLFFLIGLLLALGAYTVYATLRWLLTGRKPQVVLVWQQFGQLRRNARFGAGGSRSAADDPGAADVVDVEAREVRQDALRLPERRD